MSAPMETMKAQLNEVFAGHTHDQVLLLQWVAQCIRDLPCESLYHICAQLSQEDAIVLASFAEVHGEWEANAELESLFPDEL